MGLQDELGGEMTTLGFYIDGSGDDMNFSVDYNISDSFSVPLEESLPLILAYSLTLLLGIVGNSLVIFSIAYYRRMRTTTNVFLFSLATADLLLVMVCIPIKAAKFLSFSWEFGEALCKTVNYVQNVSMICSVLTLAWIAIERVVAVSFPLKARYISTNTRAQIMVLVIWLASFVLASPIIFIQSHIMVGERFQAYWCKKQFGSRDLHILFETYMFILLFVLPLFVMVFSYGLICVKVWVVSEVRADMRSGRVIAPVNSRHRSARTGGADHALLSHSHSDGGGSMGHHVHHPPRPCVKEEASHDRKTTKQLVIMLMVIVILFAICWGPIMVDNLLVALDIHHELNHGYLKPMRKAFNLMSYANSCVNPIVYAFMSKNFRQSFKFAICACVRGRAFVRAYRFSMSLANTRTSVVSTNGRSRIGHPPRRDKSSSSDIDYMKAMTPSPEEVELKSINDRL